MRARNRLLALVVLSAVAPLTMAQAPDCTGVSTVHNSDPDLINELDTVLVANGLTFPVYVTAAPGDMDRLFILEKRGKVRVVTNGVLQATPFLDIDPIVTGGTSSNNERGLLGLAFHPDYQNNGFFYVYYTATSPSGALTVRRYTRMTPDLADPGSGATIISINHPISNHNAGMIAFSPIDGHLYVGTGDGGSACDPGGFPGNAQNLNSLLGKMLRLDVDGAFPYSTAGNPFDGGIPGLDEIWHRGLRNPWRWSFDSQTGAQYIGDVGQSPPQGREELNCTTAGTSGLNYGWNAYEGLNCDTCNEWVAACPIDLGAEYSPPYRDYPIGSARSVIGGYVYRGCRMPDLRGTYFYSDFFNPFVNTLRTDGTCSTSAAPDTNRASDLAPGGGLSIATIASFGQDNQGELYIVEQNGGEVFKIIPEMAIMELSGPGATPFTMNAAGDFEWENLQQASDVPTRFYKVYRADDGQGPFTCTHRQLATTTTWVGGDPEAPASGQGFYYLTTAQNADGDESTAGAASDGTLRVVDTGSPCN